MIINSLKTFFTYKNNQSLDLINSPNPNIDNNLYIDYNNFINSVSFIYADQKIDNTIPVFWTKLKDNNTLTREADPNSTLRELRYNHKYYVVLLDNSKLPLKIPSPIDSYQFLRTSKDSCETAKKCNTDCEHPISIVSDIHRQLSLTSDTGHYQDVHISLSGLEPNKKYTYIIEPIYSNWPHKLSKISGEILRNSPLDNTGYVNSSIDTKFMYLLNDNYTTGISLPFNLIDTSKSDYAKNIFSLYSIKILNQNNIIVLNDTINITCDSCIPTPTPSPTPTITPTHTPTPSVTQTNTPTPSITRTNTPTPSITPTNSVTPTKTVTPTPTVSATVTSTPTPTITTTPTVTPTTSLDNNPNYYFISDNIENVCYNPLYIILIYGNFDAVGSVLYKDLLLSTTWSFNELKIYIENNNASTIFLKNRSLSITETPNTDTVYQIVSHNGIATVGSLQLCPPPPTPTPTTSVTPTPTLTTSATPTPTLSPTPTVTETPTNTPTETPTNTPTSTATTTPTPTPTPTETPPDLRRRCPTVNLTNKNITINDKQYAEIIADFTYLDPFLNYNYIFYSNEANWPTFILPLTGVAPINSTYTENNMIYGSGSIMAILEFNKDINNIANLAFNIPNYANENFFNDNLYVNLGINLYRLNNAVCNNITDTINIVCDECVSSTNISNCLNSVSTTIQGTSQSLSTILINSDCCDNANTVSANISGLCPNYSYRYEWSSSPTIEIVPISGLLNINNNSTTINSIYNLNGVQITNIKFKIIDNYTNEYIEDNVLIRCSDGLCVTPTTSPTPSITPTNSVTPTNTMTPSITPSETPTNTPTSTVTPTNTITPSVTSTNTATPTLTPTRTVTPTLTMTSTSTPTATPTNTTTPSETPTNTPTTTNTATPSETPTNTPTITVTPSITSTNTATPTVTPSYTATPTITPTISSGPIIKALSFINYPETYQVVDTSTYSLLSTVSGNLPFDVEWQKQEKNTSTWTTVPSPAKVWTNISQSMLSVLNNQATSFIDNSSSLSLSNLSQINDDGDRYRATATAVQVPFSLFGINISYLPTIYNINLSTNNNYTIAAYHYNNYNNIGVQPYFYIYGFGLLSNTTSNLGTITFERFYRSGPDTNFTSYPLEFTFKLKFSGNIKMTTNQSNNYLSKKNILYINNILYNMDSSIISVSKNDTIKLVLYFNDTWTTSSSSIINMEIVSSNSSLQEVNIVGEPIYLDINF